MDYQSALDYISSMGRFGSRPGLERMQWVLERIGHPERALRFVHIGGTNGKGSTTAFVHSILQAAGYSTGMYTSPYLDSFTNRIGAGGRDIAADQLADVVTRLKPLFDEINDSPLGPITQFEVTTLIALAYYQEQGVDCVAWEVGLGGRLDATNVVTPMVSVITNIGLDHTEILGDTLEKIAAEKAGIIKPGTPLVTAVETEEAWDVIRARAEQLGSPTWRLGSGFHYRRTEWSLQGQSFNYWDDGISLSGLRTSLLGEHQCRNAATAIAAVRRLSLQGMRVSEEAIRQGISRTLWPGRLEIMREEPLVLVDGAHNPHGTRILERAITDYFADKRIIMVLGILKDKERAQMFSHLLPHASRVIFTAPQYGRATDPDTLLKEAASYQVPASSSSTVANAIDQALAVTGKDDVLLIAGSLYTVSEAREHLKNLR